MRLPDKEIVGCITDIGIPFTVADLAKPNPVQVQMIFEWFAELLLNATRETIEPAMRAAAEDFYADYPDVISPDTRNLMGFYVSLRRLLTECGINDFSFTDLYKPTRERLVKIFSYLINFVRFRESQTQVIDEHFDKAEKTKARIETLYQDNQDMEARLNEMKHNRKAMEAQVREKNARNEELKKNLLELRRNQERVAARQVRCNLHAPSAPLSEGFGALNHPPGSRESRASEDRHRIKKRSQIIHQRGQATPMAKDQESKQGARLVNDDAGAQATTYPSAISMRRIILMTHATSTIPLTARRTILATRTAPPMS